MGKGGNPNIMMKKSSQSMNETQSSTQISGRKISWKEVQEHRDPSNAWTVHNNKVYDISSWYEHPGGAVIFTHAGDDMTDIFAAFHAPGSIKMIQQFYIGDLIVDTNETNNATTTPRKTKEQIDFEMGYRNLRTQLINMGMFKSNTMFYTYKCISNQCLWALSIAMVYYFPNNTLMHMLSAITMGLFFQQCGWLAHDYLHHQVCKGNRRLGDLFGIYWGNLMQGYSVQWWKNKHNGHHAVPNLHNSTATSQDGDPDIDTMPLLAWSLQQARSYRQLSLNGQDSAFVKFMIRYQAYFYFPILLLARLSWLNESFKVAFNLGAATENAALELKVRGLQYPLLERGGIILHYLWVLVLSTGFGQWSVLYSMSYFLLMTASCGFMLALVFGLGHNGMAVYDADKRPDFWKLQVTTTRNIIGGHGIPQSFVDWFCGGLQYQVDHHLFPTLPRHNLKKAHELVKSFCKEWNVQYHEADLIDGTIEVLHHLSNVSDEFIVDFVRDGPTM